MHTEYMSEELKRQIQEIFSKIKEDPERYFTWIKEEIEKVFEQINSFDKIYVLGGLGARLIKATSNPYSLFLESYDGPDKEFIDPDELKQEDDEIELLLEYAISIAMASANLGWEIPEKTDIDEIYDQLSKIKYNMGMWEMAAEIPGDETKSDHWLRTQVVTESINVRGNGYHVHVVELFKELFEPFNEYLNQFYGFDANDLLEVILNLDNLVYSKIGNPFGSMQSHNRFKEWAESVGEDRIMETVIKTGKNFIEQFTEANRDLYNAENPSYFLMRSLDDIDSYPTIFRVIPKTTKEEKIFEFLSAGFGDNGIFLTPPKYKGFILNDTIITLKPLIKSVNRYYHFSLNLAFRNIFRIADNLLKSAGEVYYENNFVGNTNKNSKDNYVEQKAKSLFEKLLPNARFYHSLDYQIFDESGKVKKTELDILGVSDDAVYIIEVKAGLLNDKHKRGALKGLKQRLEKTVAAGSYQCQRALKYIHENEAPVFTYASNNKRNSLTVDKSKITEYYKITVTFEHLGGVAANLKYLVTSGILSEDYKWSWIVSLYDLMIFADIMPDETTFKEYLNNRIPIYDREDISFSDEIDILGYQMDGQFPLKPENDKEHLQIVGFKGDIDRYFEEVGMMVPNPKKPVFKSCL